MNPILVYHKVYNWVKSIIHDEKKDERYLFKKKWTKNGKVKRAAKNKLKENTNVDYYKRFLEKYKCSRSSSSTPSKKYLIEEIVDWHLMQKKCYLKSGGYILIMLVSFLLVLYKLSLFASILNSKWLAGSFYVGLMFMRLDFSSFMHKIIEQLIQNETKNIIKKLKYRTNKHKVIFIHLSIIFTNNNM